MRPFGIENMPVWIPMFALPNIEVEEAIELDGMALATMSDPRIQTLAAQHQTFSDYLDSFRSEFNRHINPSIIIRRDDTPELYRTVDALAGFRDAIALSVVPYAWAEFLRYGHAPEVRYSDSFSIYPWMLDKNYEYVVMRSIGEMGVTVTVMGWTAPRSALMCQDGRCHNPSEGSRPWSSLSGICRL